MFPFFRCDVVTFKKPWDRESLSNFVKIIAELRLLLKDKVSVIAGSIMIFRACEPFFFNLPLRCPDVQKPWDPGSLSNFLKVIAELRLHLKDKVSVIAESIMIFRTCELIF